MRRSILLVDGHVHIYDCYDLDKFFDTAVRELEKSFGLLYRGVESVVHQKILLLTEGKGNDYFKQWQEKGTEASPHGYWFGETGEEISLELFKGEQPVGYVVRGRQIVTRENLEVLSIASSQWIPDGLPIEEVIQRLVEKEEIAVLAWGFGKWLFKRGKVISREIEKSTSQYLVVGDNSGRPVFWPTPGLFKKARKAKIPLIGGSDPLPFSQETAKVGTYGFCVEGEFDITAPARSLRDLLVNRVPVRIFGSRDGLLSFCHRQSRIYFQKYFKKF